MIWQKIRKYRKTRMGLWHIFITLVSSRPFQFILQYKKVLLRERKRHTARRVVSTPSVVLPGPRYPPLGGYTDLGTPPGGGTQTSVPPRGGVPGPPWGGLPGPPRGGTRTSVPPWGGTGPRYPLPPGGVPGPWYPPGGVPRPWFPPPRGVPGPRYPPGGGTRTLVPPGGGTRTSVPPSRGGYPDLSTPLGGYPDLGTPPGVPRPWYPLGGYPDLGTPRGGVPGPRYPPRGGTRTLVTPPPPPGGVPGPRYPPRGGSGYPPRLPHGILGNVAKHYGIWVPPPVDRQIDGWTDACQNITFPRTTYAGGKYLNCP